MAETVALERITQLGVLLSGRHAEKKPSRSLAHPTQFGGNGIAVFPTACCMMMCSRLLEEV